MGKIKSPRDFINMYVDGFKHLTWGKPLWILILIKLFILFAILKIFFFPNIINRHAQTEKEKSEFVFKQLTNKQSTNEKKLPDESD